MVSVEATPIWGGALLLLYAGLIALLRIPWSPVAGPLVFIVGFSSGAIVFYREAHNNCPPIGCPATLHDFIGLYALALVVAALIYALLYWLIRTGQAKD